jgi:hypothetical protein
MFFIIVNGLDFTSIKIFETYKPIIPINKIISPENNHMDTITEENPGA